MLNIICLKHGTKYSSDYVNRLFNMVKRNLSIPHRFICFTENTNGLKSEIEVLPLPNINGLQGWWYKPYFFKRDLFNSGDINFSIDLDMVIVKNIDKLITYQPEKFMGLQDPTRVFRPDSKKLGSAVMRWPAGSYSDIWESIAKDPSISKKFHGDQDWIWYMHKNSINFYPRDWILSYKWEVRKKSDLLGYREQTRFKDNISPKLHKDTSILAFHGFPQVHQVKDAVIVDNWY